jgi:hypothetical protein
MATGSLGLRRPRGKNAARMRRWLAEFRAAARPDAQGHDVHEQRNGEKRGCRVSLAGCPGTARRRTETRADWPYEERRTARSGSGTPNAYDAKPDDFPPRPKLSG